MARKKTEVELLTERLAKAIAKEHFEFALDMYEDSAVDLADEGVTERTYVQGCDELIYTQIESISDDLNSSASEEYARLYAKKYGQRRR